jgi:hypothetical protein
LSGSCPNLIDLGRIELLAAGIEILEAEILHRLDPIVEFCIVEAKQLEWERGFGRTSHRGSKGLFGERYRCHWPAASAMWRRTQTRHRGSVVTREPARRGRSDSRGRQEEGARNPVGDVVGDVLVEALETRERGGSIGGEGGRRPG